MGIIPFRKKPIQPDHPLIEWYQKAWKLPLSLAQVLATQRVLPNVLYFLREDKIKEIRGMTTDGYFKIISTRDLYTLEELSGDTIWENTI